MRNSSSLQQQQLAAATFIMNSNNQQQRGCITINENQSFASLQKQTTHNSNAPTTKTPWRNVPR
jgi:hypothetical protein